MVGQRRLVLPAVRQHAVAVVGQALFVQLLEGPEHGLHVLDVERLVVVLEVHPARLAGDVALPLVGVLHHGGAAGVVELVDAHGLDLGLVRHAQLLHGFQLGGQAVGVPAEAALHPACRAGSGSGPRGPWRSRSAGGRSAAGRWRRAGRRRRRIRCCRVSAGSRSRWSMLAWKVPSWSQYLRMRSSISGNFTEADTPARRWKQRCGAGTGGCGGGLGVISHLDILG